MSQPESEVPAEIQSLLAEAETEIGHAFLESLQQEIIFTTQTIAMWQEKYRRMRSVLPEELQAYITIPNLYEGELHTRHPSSLLLQCPGLLSIEVLIDDWQDQTQVSSYQVILESGVKRFLPSQYKYALLAARSGYEHKISTSDLDG